MPCKITFKIAVMMAMVGTALSASMTMTGCSGAFNDKPKTQASINLGGSETQCLSDASVRIKNYFEGHSTQKEIEGFWDCTSRALELFINHTKGKESDSYRPEELRDFFQKYFIGNNKISDELLEQAMILKDAVLGGGQDRLSKREVSRLREVITIFKEQSVRLLKYQPFYGDVFKIKSEAVTDQAAVELIDSAKILGLAIGKTTKSYEFKDFGKLLTALDRYFVASGTPVPAIKNVYNYLALIQSAKNILVSRPREIISGDDWEKLLVTVTRWYSWSLKLSNFESKYVEVLWGPGLARMKTLIDEAKEYLVSAVKDWPDATIDFGEINILIDAADGPDNRFSKWFVDGFQAKHVKDSIEPIIRNLLGGYDITTTGRNAKGLTATALERLYTKTMRFIEGQRFIEALFNAAKGENEWNETTGLTPEELLLASSKVEKDYDPGVVIDMKRIFQTYRPLFLKQELQVFFNAPDALDRKHTFYNLKHMNWMQQVSRLVMQAYGGNDSEGNAHPEGLERAEKLNGIRVAEYNRFYLDIFALGAGLHFFSSQKTVPLTSESRFMEANLFAFASDGGEYLSLDEMTQMFAILTSTKVLSGRIYNEVLKELVKKDENGNSVCAAFEKDEYGNIQIEENCFKYEFFNINEDGKNNFMIYWQNMPGMADFYQKLSDEQRATFRNILITAVRGDHIKSPLWNTDDTDALATLSHYIEAVFSRFDDNGDQFLNKGEAYDKSGKTDDAFHVFSYELEKLTCKHKKKMLKNIFLYMLKYGKPPDPATFKGKMKYVWWTIIQPFSKIKANRTTILTILSTLANMKSTPNTGADCSPKPK